MNGLSNSGDNLKPLPASSSNQTNLQNVGQLSLEQVKVRELFRRIERDLSTYMPCDYNVIVQKYPEIDTIFPRLSAEERLEYNLMIKKCYLQKLMTNRRSFIPKALEKIVLSKLGYKSSNYQDPSILAKKVKEIIEEKLQSENLASQSLGEIKEELKERIVAERIKLAGVKPEHIGRVQAIIQSARKYQDHLIDTSKPYKTAERLEKGPEVARKIIEKKKNAAIVSVKNRELSGFFAKNLTELKSLISNESEDQFENSLDELFSSHFKDPRTVSIFKEKLGQLEEKMPTLAWFNKYQNNITVQFNQDFSSKDEILGEGICMTLVYRFMNTILKNPHIKDEDMKMDQIFSRDHLMQAAHDLTRRLKPSKRYNFDEDILTGSFLEDYSYPKKLSELKEKMLLTSNSEALFNPTMVANQIMQMNGVYCLILNSSSTDSGSHAIHGIGIHIDRDNGVYRVYDPNLGMIRIQPGDQGSSDPLKDVARMLESYLRNFYPNKDKIFIIENKLRQ